MVLHTHSRQLEFHPHVHCIVPTLALDKSNWLIKQKAGRYLFNAPNLAKVFRRSRNVGLLHGKAKLKRRKITNTKAEGYLPVLPS